VASSAHFIENHDERRAAEALALEQHGAAALVVLGLPGLRLLHDGQLTGARLKLPVQLARRPKESPVAEVQKLYKRILAALPKAGVGQGLASLIAPRPAWPENPTGQNFILVLWRSKPEEFALVVVNLAPHRSQCYVTLSVPGLAERHWNLRDRLSEESYVRVGSDIAQQGLYLDLPAHGAQVFHFTPAA
jgi:hypothetical protein